MKLLTSVVAMVLLTQIASCGPQGPDFVGYDFDGFSVALPTRQPAARTEQGPDGTISSVSARVNETRYLVVYWELPMYLRGVSDDQILESMSLGAGAWKVHKQAKVTVAGMPAREIEGETANGNYMLTRMLRTRDRVYLLSVGGGKYPTRRKAANPFFDSFRLHP